MYTSGPAIEGGTDHEHELARGADASAGDHPPAGILRAVSGQSRVRFEWVTEALDLPHSEAAERRTEEDWSSAGVHPRAGRSKKEVGMSEHPGAVRARASIDAYNRQDMEALRDFYTEDVAWHVAGKHGLSGDYRGRDELFAYFDRVKGA